MIDINQKIIKTLLLFMGFIFIGMITFSFYANEVFNMAIDASIYATTILVSGALFGGSVFWYFFKTAKRTVYECKIYLHKESHYKWWNTHMHKYNNL